MPAAWPDLEVQVAGGGAGLAGLADAADPIAGVDAVALAEARPRDHVGVEDVGLRLEAVDDDEVAEQLGVVVAALDVTAPGRVQGGAAVGVDVLALVGA